MGAAVAGLDPGRPGPMGVNAPGADPAPVAGRGPADARDGRRGQRRRGPPAADRPRRPAPVQAIRPAGVTAAGSASMDGAAATSRRSKSLPHQAHSDQSIPTRRLQFGQTRFSRVRQDGQMIHSSSIRPLAARAVVDRLDLGEERLLGQVPLPDLADLLVRPDDLVDPDREDEEDRGEAG